MPQEGLSEDIRRFLRLHVNSIEQLEILLRLNAIAPQSESSAAIASALYLSPESVEARLNAYVQKGVVLRSSGSPAQYELKHDPGIRRHIDSLAKLYRERRVSIINEIFSNPNDAIQTFADAFIIGRKKE